MDQSHRKNLCANVSNCRSFYQALKAVYNPFIPCNSDFKLHTDKDSILNYLPSAF